MNQNLEMIKQFILHVNNPPDNINRFVDCMVGFVVAVFEIIKPDCSDMYFRVTYDTHRRVVTVWQYNVSVPQFVTYYLNEYFKHQTIFKCNAVHVEFITKNYVMEVKAHGH